MKRTVCVPCASMAELGPEAVPVAPGRHGWPSAKLAPHTDAATAPKSARPTLVVAGAGAAGARTAPATSIAASEVAIQCVKRGVAVVSFRGSLE